MDAERQYFYRDFRAEPIQDNARYFARFSLQLLKNHISAHLVSD